MTLTDPFLVSLFFVFAAEMGDKTILMTVTLASQHHSFVPVWRGSSLGTVVADGLAIIVGKVLGAKLPEKLIEYGAAAVFLVTGVVTPMGRRRTRRASSDRNP